MIHACQFDPRVDCAACAAEEQAAEQGEDDFCACGQDRLPGRGMCAECTTWWDRRRT